MRAPKSANNDRKHNDTNLLKLHYVQYQYIAIGFLSKIGNAKERKIKNTLHILDITRVLSSGEDKWSIRQVAEFTNLINNPDAATQI